MKNRWINKGRISAKHKHEDSTPIANAKASINLCKILQDREEKEEDYEKNNNSKNTSKYSILNMKSCSHSADDLEVDEMQLVISNFTQKENM